MTERAKSETDKLIGEEHAEVNVDAMTFDEMDAFIAEHEDIICPVCGKHPVITKADLAEQPVCAVKE